VNLANRITTFRIFLSLIFIVLLCFKGAIFSLAALLVFSLAGFTDFLDGYIAKRLEAETDFGRIADPIADKILTLSAFIAFALKGIAPFWMVAVIVLREVAVTGFRLFAVSKGRVLPAGAGGKYKTVSQICVIIFILIFSFLRGLDAEYFDIMDNALEAFLAGISYLLMLITTALTAVTGISVIWKNGGILSGAKKNA
jgi:CDP-diacylglycerol--glycerol-3-phosphate 3-phosphatidyltransferase